MIDYYHEIDGYCCRVLRAHTEPGGGQLNADWASILMGYSANWTAVDGSAE